MRLGRRRGIAGLALIGFCEFLGVVYSPAVLLRSRLDIHG